jgi:tryprostatin B 6-hydroxylase
MYALTYLQLFCAICIGSGLYLTHLGGLSTGKAVATVSALAFSWLGGVYASLLVYRIWLHPLHAFPGPWQARIGDLWLSTQLTNLDGYYLLEGFHEKYGKYVRVGSDVLSVTDPAIMQPAYGANAKVVKGDWYDGGEPHHSMHTTRNKALHDRRRRVWYVARRWMCA